MTAGPRQVGTASHDFHGSDLLPVLAVHDAHDRVAMYVVTTPDGQALVIGSLAALVNMGYTVHWDPAPPRRWRTRPPE